MSARLNEFQNATVGMTVGCIEVMMLQPINYAKNMVQQRAPISFNPMVMYRGVGPNVVNMGSCTMVQFAVGGKLKQVVTGGALRKLSTAEEMGTGIAAGFISGLVGAPLELIMIQQQRKGGGIVHTVGTIATPSLFYRGFIGCAIREALWTCGYLSIPPIVRAKLRESYPTTFDSNEKARVPAALLGGLFACYLSHPFDTIKTCMQGDIERKEYGTLTQAARRIWGDSGIAGFYRGATLRYSRMVIAVFLMDTLNELIGPLLYPSAFED